MVRQYPYTLQVLQTIEAHQNGSGDFVAESTSWVDVCKCRNEDGKQRKISVSDGTFSVANHLIQCPKGVEAMNFGDKVKVIGENSEVRVEGSVIYSSKEQLHTRIWV